MRQATGKPRGHRSPRKIDVTRKLTVVSVSVVTLIRTDTTLDHSQKAEKVWFGRLRMLKILYEQTHQHVLPNETPA